MRSLLVERYRDRAGDWDGVFPEGEPLGVSRFRRGCHATAEALDAGEAVVVQAWELPHELRPSRTAFHVRVEADGSLTPVHPVLTLEGEILRWEAVA